MVSMIDFFASFLVGLLSARAVIFYLHHRVCTVMMMCVVCLWLCVFFHMHITSGHGALSYRSRPICDIGIEADLFILTCSILLVSCFFHLCRTTI